MKKLAVSLLFSLIMLLSINTVDSQAAENPQKTTVSLSTLIARENPSPSAKSVGSFKKGNVVYVHSTRPGGWAEVRYNGKPAYVPAMYLKLTNSYLPQKSKKYSYSYYEGSSTMKYIGTSGGYDRWRSIFTYAEKEENVLYFSESLEGLFSGYYYSGKFIKTQDLKYPIKAGTVWTNVFSGDDYYAVSKHMITSTSVTRKTPVGTFKNVVQVAVETNDGYSIHRYYDYYAKGVGWIGSRERDGSCASACGDITSIK
ncbi:uncharacterized protein YgiM (DUF1202 family) [Bacillus ectoiniformans]|uniref:SH3 domain-containing protein n=1 Tax=Bacillus ectoiniformans TaxID=1494429 RepID=UPI00195BB3E0|nr:SH3 domain-containing protein [Bacillus ectoiniformans]MBM7648444.1 uncharacterized protein YgiM (DUF1202 family) [Bacillus ectoiniformans]